MNTLDRRAHGGDRCGHATGDVNYSRRPQVRGVSLYRSVRAPHRNASTVMLTVLAGGRNAFRWRGASRGARRAKLLYTSRPSCTAREPSSMKCCCSRITPRPGDSVPPLPRRLSRARFERSTRCTRSFGPYMKTAIVFLVTALAIGTWRNPSFAAELLGRYPTPYEVSAHTHAVLRLLRDGADSRCSAAALSAPVEATTRAIGRSSSRWRTGCSPLQRRYASSASLRGLRSRHPPVP